MCGVVLPVFLACCSGTSHTVDIEFGEEYTLSPRAGLGYKTPAGWFDASADSINEGGDVLIVRDDYAASLSIHELSLDHIARARLQQEGAAILATMSQKLALAGDNARILAPVSKHVVQGREFFSFENVEVETGDTVIVAVMEKRGSAVEVRGRISGKAGKTTRAEVLAVRDAFISRLRW